MPLQWRHVGNRRPLMTVTSCGHVGVLRIVGDAVDPRLRDDLPRFEFLVHDPLHL